MDPATRPASRPSLDDCGQSRFLRRGTARRFRFQRHIISMLVVAPTRTGKAGETTTSSNSRSSRLQVGKRPSNLRTRAGPKGENRGRRLLQRQTSAVPFSLACQKRHDVVGRPTSKKNLMNQNTSSCFDLVPAGPRFSQQNNVLNIGTGLARADFSTAFLGLLSRHPANDPRFCFGA